MNHTSAMPENTIYARIGDAKTFSRNTANSLQKIWFRNCWAPGKTVPRQVTRKAT